jgi:superkiller protein 3
MDFFEPLIILLRQIVRDVFGPNKGKLNKSQAQAHYNLAQRFMESKQLDRAREEYLKALAFYPYLDDALVGLGIIYYHQAKLDKARKAFEEAYTINIQSSRACYWVGRVSYDDKKYTRAEKMFKKAIKHKESFPEAHYYLGLTYLNKNMYDFALEYFEKTLKLNPDWTDAFIYLGETYLKKGDSTKAISMLENANSLLIDSYEAMSYLSQAYFAAKQHDKALKTAKQILEINPGCIDTHYLLWKIYKDRGMNELAELEKGKIVRLNPDYKITMQIDNVVSLNRQNNEEGVRPEDAGFIARLFKGFKKI